MAKSGRFVKTLLFGVLVLLAGVTYIWLRPSTNETSFSDDNLALINAGADDQTNESNGNDAVIGDSKEYTLENSVSRISANNSAFLHIAMSTGMIYYYTPETGKIMSINSDENASSTNVGTIPPLAKNISWAPDGKELYATYYNGTYYYNLKNGTTQKIDEKIYHPTFSLSQNRISYIYFNKDTGEGKISISDQLMSGYKNIFPTRYTEWDTHWISEKRIALINDPNDNTAFSSLALLDVEDSSLVALIMSKKDLEVSWSSYGTRFVYSYDNTRTNKYELRYFDIADSSDSRLGLYTIASKCAWKNDNQTIYCAVPEVPIASGGVNRNTNDAFYEIDIASNMIIKKLTPTTDIDVSEIVYSPQKEALLFINEKNGNLYELPVN